MISLEQVQQLETKVARAIEYVQRVTEENTSLVSEKASLVTRLEASQKRLDELELLIMSFKEDQGRIEDGIIAALNRLSQFEEAFESGLKPKDTEKPAPKKAPVKKSETSEFFEITGSPGGNEPAIKEKASIDTPIVDPIDVNIVGSADDSIEANIDGELDIF